MSFNAYIITKGKMKRNQLSVNGIWKWFRPPLQDFFVKNIGKLYAYDFLPMILKFYWPTFRKCQGYSFPRELSRDLFSKGG